LLEHSFHHCILEAGLSVLYVSPIRALLNNQEYRLDRYFKLVGRRACVWHGDTSQSEKGRIGAEPPDCLLTTPESLEVILTSPRIALQDRCIARGNRYAC
jgi:ATP-dependent Lhr-like helicase